MLASHESHASRCQPHAYSYLNQRIRDKVKLPPGEHLLSYTLIMVFVSHCPLASRRSAFIFFFYQGRISRGIYELPKVSPESAMPYPCTPYGQPPLKRPYSCFSGGHPQGGRPAAVLLPPWISHAVRLCFIFFPFMLGGLHVPPHFISDPPSSAVILSFSSGCPFFIVFGQSVICERVSQCLLLSF
jgi:hypothetical protein